MPGPLSLSALIHPSAWKGNSPKLNFRFTAFYEVAPALLTLHTGLVDQLKARPTGPAIYVKEVGQSYVRCSAALRGRDRLAKGGAAGRGGLRAHHRRNAGIRGLLLCRRRGRRDGFDQRLRAKGRRGAVELQGRRVRGGGCRSLGPEPA